MSKPHENELGTLDCSASGLKKIEGWLAEGWVVAAFQNVDLGHRDRGECIYLPFGREDVGRLEVGKTKAPDTDGRMGWRYILVEVVTDIGRFREVSNGS